MSRWLVLAAFSMAFLTVGCGSSVRAGLANAPRLGGIPTVDERVTDAVSNGDDACGLYAESGTLRNRIPPCPRATSVHSVSASSGRPASNTPPNGDLVEPWLDHFYVGWPCSARNATSVTRASPWSSSRRLVAVCSAP